MTVKPKPLVVGQSVKLAIIDASTYDTSRPIVILTKYDEFEFLRLETILVSRDHFGQVIISKRKRKPARL